MVNKELLKKAAIEDDFDEAFATIHEALGEECESSNINVLPNVEDARNILKKAKCNYHELGLWIIIKSEETMKWYNEFDMVYDALEKSELYPIVAHGYGAEHFIDCDFEI